MEKQLRDKKLEALYHRIGLVNNLSGAEVKKIIESPYEFAKEKINELDLKEVKEETEFELLKTNFLFKYLGKLHTNFKTIAGRRKQSEAFKQINKEKWEK
jgi:hypothetical protein